MFFLPVLLKIALPSQVYLPLAPYRLLEKQTIKPISIQMNEGKATIDIRLLVEPNAKIPVLSRKLQEAVKDAVQSMTGIEVATVNLYIAGVSVPRTAKTAE